MSFVFAHNLKLLVEIREIREIYHPTIPMPWVALLAARMTRMISKFVSGFRVAMLDTASYVGRKSEVNIRGSSFPGNSPCLELSLLVSSFGDPFSCV